mgnify:CR=1 FL=1
MTNQPALKEDGIRDDLGSQTNQVPVNSKPYYRVIVIKPKTYEEGILDNAMKNLNEIVEEPEPTVTKIAEKTLNPVNPAKPIKAENKDLDSIVGDYHGSDVNPELNTFYNENGATLTEPDNLMAHYTTAGTNLFNNLGSKVKNIYNGIRSIKAKSIKKAGLKLLLPAGVSALLLLTSCSGVTPPGPIQKIEIPAGFDKDYFEEVCFSTEFPSNNSHDIYRWTDDPKIFLINPPTEEKRKICENKIDELAEFTNYVLSPKIVDDINFANITVEWCELEEIPQQQVGYGSFYQKNNNKNGKSRKSKITYMIDIMPFILFYNQQLLPKGEF